MIVRINKAKGFNDSVRYVIDEKKNAVVIGSNLKCGITASKAEIIREMDERAKCWKGWPKKVTLWTQPETEREKRIKKCVHLSMAFSPRDVLTEPLMAEIGTEMVNRLGWEQGQHIIVTHDKGKIKEEQNHQHQHIIINRVTEDGGLLKLGRAVGYRSLRIQRELERQYGLEQIIGWDEYGFRGSSLQYRKWLESSRKRSVKKFEIQSHILDNLRNADSTDIVDFLHNLESNWLEIQYWNKDNNYSSPYKLEEVADRLREGEHFGISYGVYNEDKHEILGFSGRKLGKLGTLEGIKGYLAEDEKFRNLHIPITLQDYQANHQGLTEREHPKQRTARVEIPVMTNYLSYLNEQNHKLLTLEDEEAKRAVKEQQEAREQKQPELIEEQKKKAKEAIAREAQKPMVIERGSITMGAKKRPEELRKIPPERRAMALAKVSDRKLRAIQKLREQQEAKRQLEARKQERIRQREEAMIKEQQRMKEQEEARLREQQRTREQATKKPTKQKNKGGFEL